ncbi:MAG: Pr6Pr family membrane protein, partial [Actinomycetota bacterium]|nr:Pr6Pr family membrane protein [Actinomycetota bacterium]
LHGLVYFTNQTAILLVVVMVWGALSQVTRLPRPPAWFKGAVVVFLLITALVSYFVLAPESPDAPAIFLGLTSGTIEHELNPLLVALDFILFDAHRRLRWRHAALWLLYLVAYAAFTTIRAELIATPDYPYGFVDLGELGWGGFGLNIAMYGVGFYVLGLVVVGLDRVLPAKALLGSSGRPAGHGSR